MNECKLEPSKSLQNSASLDVCCSSNITTKIPNSRSSFFKGNQNISINQTNNHPNKNKKSKGKQKIKRANPNKEKIFKDGSQKLPERKRRSVPFIPQTIKFRSQSKTRISCAFSKASSDKKLSQDHWFKNENQIVMSHSIMRPQIKANNEEHLKSSLKPNRLNFMSRASNIFDLFISNTNLPKFVQSFLNRALLILRKNRINFDNKQNCYDEKLEEFKKICEGIYESSEEQELKHFMTLSLPNMNRWIPKNIVHNTTVNFRKATRSPELTNLTNLNQYSLLHFKPSKKQQTQASKPEKESVNLIGRLNSKLDQFIKSLQGPSIHVDKFEEFKQFPKSHQNNNGLRWRKRKSLKEVT